MNDYEIMEAMANIQSEIIEQSTIIVSIMIGFGLTLLVGFISWGISIAVRTFVGIIRGT